MQRCDGSPHLHVQAALHDGGGAHVVRIEEVLVICHSSERGARGVDAPQHQLQTGTAGVTIPAIGGKVDMDGSMSCHTDRVQMHLAGRLEASSNTSSPPALAAPQSAAQNLRHTANVNWRIHAPART